MDLEYAADELIIASHLRRIGEDDRAYRRARERGQLVSPHRGVFVEANTWMALPPSDRYNLQIRGAALASRSNVTLAHASAAALWGAPLLRTPSLVHVLSSPAVGTRVENGFRRHASDRVGWEVVQRNGLALTSLARTVVEFCRDMPFRDAVTLIDWAIRPSTSRHPKPFTTKAEITRVADELGFVRGRKKLDRALEFANGSSGSPGESLSRVVMLECGFPAPELQVDFFDPAGFIGTVDFWWPAFNLIGEFDGVAKYIRDEYTGGQSAADIVIAEKNRENRLRATGPGVTRWDWPIAESVSLLRAHLTSAGLDARSRG